MNTNGVGLHCCAEMTTRTGLKGPIRVTQAHATQITIH